MNTDNAWMEISAATVHDNQNIMSSDFKVIYLTQMRSKIFISDRMRVSLEK